MPAIDVELFFEKADSSLSSDRSNSRCFEMWTRPMEGRSRFYSDSLGLLRALILFFGWRVLLFVLIIFFMEFL